MILFTLLVMNALYGFGMFSTRPIIPIYAESIGIPFALIGLLVSSYSFLSMLMAVRAGRWVDRVGSKRMVFLGGSGLLLAFLLPLFSFRLPLLFLSQLIFGFSQLLVILSIQKTVGNLPGNRDKLITAHSLSAAFGDMLGPLVSGFTFAHYGFGFSFGLAAATTLAALILGCLLKSHHWRVGASNMQEAYPYSGSTWTLLKHVNLRKSLIISGVGLYSKELIVAYFPLYGMKIGMSVSEIGIILSISAMMTIAVRFIQYQIVQKFGRTQVMTAALFFSAVAFLLIAWTQIPVILAIIIALMGAGLGIVQPLSIVYALNYTSADRHGEVLGIRLSINRILQFAAPIIFGGAGGYFGLQFIFVANGIIMMTGAYFTRIPPSVEHTLPAEDPLHLSSDEGTESQTVRRSV
ncbi:MFS transporter [Paenibacillus sp. GP183]|jgi:MFS family permease|uniref:MFS transporter n=1 Tax=Paenibacillus sp. GP183 TaxID=1882751 RepID=UPI000894C25E|nr:MFS transporter [Paenibacillus sp. GP183]SEB72255.1 Predicted arabinose efflux permease, MFS family [Paenibacillus sp. GP183]